MNTSLKYDPNDLCKAGAGSLACEEIENGRILGRQVAHRHAFPQAMTSIPHLGFTKLFGWLVSASVRLSVCPSRQFNGLVLKLRMLYKCNVGYFYIKKMTWQMRIKGAKNLEM